MNILSIDIDYIISEKDFVEVSALFCKALSSNPDIEIKFSQYHADIIDLIKEVNEEMLILNIDMHHDIIYDEVCDTAEIRNGMYDSTNWLCWVAAFKKIKKYIWCKNSLSDPFDAELSSSFNQMFEKDRAYDVVDSRNVLFSSKLALTQKIDEIYLKYKPKIEIENKIQNYFHEIPYDKVFVCLSPDYTKDDKYFCYDVLQNIYLSFKKS
tara:strand:- start:2246 stop:2875 length:630 start_codon:yes stop_codon:yes gene_type:complete